MEGVGALLVHWLAVGDLTRGGGEFLCEPVDECAVPRLTGTLLSGTALVPITIAYGGDANNAASSSTITLDVRIAPELLVPILNAIFGD